jgi:hypothetical protein
MAILGTIHFLDSLTAFGLLAVALMLVFYALENRSRHFTLLFALACALGSAYGFLQGAWPFGAVEAVWAVVAVTKWRQLGRSLTQAAHERQLLTYDPVDAFLEDLQLATRQASPGTFAFMGEDEKPIGYVQLHRSHPAGGIVMHRIWTLAPHTGAGSKIMTTLCNLADHHGVEIALQTLPFGDKPYPLSADQLFEWYSGYGFAGTPKRMRRKPQAIEEEGRQLDSAAAPIAAPVTAC